MEERLKIELTEQETKDYHAFCEEHIDCYKKHLHKPFYSSIGGQFTLTVTPTGLGNGVHVKCNACGEDKDITDVSN